MIYHQLSNGIRVLMDPMPYVHSISIGAWVLAGSVYENGRTSGISHAIEHMVFKGTTSRSAKDIAQQMDAIGANLNAFTSKECTCFYVKALDSDMPVCVDILADLIKNSVLDENEFENEKKVILEEIAMNEDSPEDLAFDIASRDYFRASSYERDILGTIESVSSMHSSDLRDYMNERYTADKIVISAAGSFQPSELLLEIENVFSGIMKKASQDLEIIHPEGGLTYRFIPKDVEQINMTFLFPGAPLNTADSYPLSVLSNILGGSMSSRLFQHIREERGLCYSIYSYPVSFRTLGAFCIYSGCTEKQAEEACKGILYEINDLVHNGIEPDEFNRAKKQMQRSYLLGMESSSAHMNINGKTALLLDKEYDMESVLQKIKAVTMNDVLDLIPRVFKAEKLSVAVVGRAGSCSENLEKRIRSWYNN